MTTFISWSIARRVFPANVSKRRIFMNNETSGALSEFGVTLLFVFITIVCINLVFLFIRRKKPTGKEFSKSVSYSMSRLAFYCIEFVIGVGIILFLVKTTPVIIGNFTDDFATTYTLSFIIGIILGWICYIFFKKARILIFEKSPTQIRAWSIYLGVSFVIVYLLYFF